MRELTRAFACLFLLSVLFHAASGQDKVISLTFNGDSRMQQMQGIGVNANTRSWKGAALEPALDLLIDSMKSNLWRVVVETVEKWEDVNDNDDPFTFNWDYYNKLYQTPKFQKVWEMIRYLNKRGITDNLMVNFMGWLPAWMGGEVIKPAFEDEYVEMLVSFLYYARNVEHLRIRLVGPMNEPDLVKEGPTVGPEQYVRVLRKLIGRMDALGMQDVRYVAPDLANMKTIATEYMPLLMKDPLIMRHLAYWGMHSYGGYYWDVNDSIRNSAYPHIPFWMTEWNAWRDGLDDGKVGIYDFRFARDCVKGLLELIKNGASAGIAWEGYDSYYEHHFPSKGSYWGILGHDTITGKYLPRKHFYAISQISKFVRPGSWQIAVSGANAAMPGADAAISGADTTLTVAAFYDELSRRVSIVAINNLHAPVTVEGLLENIPGVKQFDAYRTDSIVNLLRSQAVKVVGNAFTLTIPGNCILTLTGVSDKNNAATKPEPQGWFTGDIHVHRSCGEEPMSEKEISDRMKANNLDVISLLADMGNAEVKHADEDLPKVNGKDASSSLPGHILHWDTEWHWDATYSQFGHQALGGHLVLLGLQNAHQIWTESPYRVLDWAGKQGAVRGFAHMQYLDNSIQNNLDCCIPIDYPVEAALGKIEFVSEDVRGSENAILAYYRLLNCGFRIGLAAGTDYPCNFQEPIGTLLTYVHIPDKGLTYRKWINGIAQGRTVVSRNAHHEFLDLRVNGDGPGSDIRLPGKGTITISAVWTADKEIQGRIELVSNGTIIGTRAGNAAPGMPVTLSIRKEFLKSGWICARRMDKAGHITHTSPVYITVGNRPVRANADDARFFIGWIDNILRNTEPGGPWNKFFSEDPEGVKAHYLKARKKYEQILDECLKEEAHPAPRPAEKSRLTTGRPAETPPVLVIAGKDHFGLYTGELLKAEGINEFLIVDPGDPVIDAAYMKRFDLVILAVTQTDTRRLKQLSDYVGNGGNLITFSPDASLGSLLGFKETQSALREAYLRVDRQTAIGRGIAGETMQFHGDGKKVTRTRGETIATYFADAVTGTAFPAVIHSSFGKGSTVSFLYNLPESIVAMHQGNVKWKNQERDGMTGLRNMDMFVGMGDEPNWIDKEKMHIPQADEQVRLFSHAVEYLLRNKTPLPRLWYFPADQKALTILTCDGENRGARDFNENHIEEELQLVRAKGGAMTVYLIGTDIAAATVNRWRNEGHEIAIHFDDTKNARNPTYENMSQVYSESIKDFLDKYDDSTRKFHLKSVRNHWITWVGWSTQAEIEVEHGLSLDCNSYKFDNSPEIIRQRWMGKAGYYTGSAIPMKFTDETGKVLDIYQSETQVVDEQLGPREGIFNTYKILLDRSLQEEDYAVVNTLFHPDKTPMGAYMDDLAKVCDYSNRFGVPLWTAERLLQFLRARDEASFTGTSWANGALRFRINSTLGGEQLTFMVPVKYKGRRAVGVRVVNRDQGQGSVNQGQGSVNLPWKTEMIKGTEYIMATVASGNTSDITVTYSPL